MNKFNYNMNGQEKFKPSGLQRVETSAPVYYLEVEPTHPLTEPSNTEIALDSQDVPMNILLNSSRAHHILVPVAKVKQADQVCLNVEPSIENNGYSINNQEEYLTNKHALQMSIEQINDPVVTSSISHEISIQIVRYSDSATQEENVKQKRVPIENFVAMPDRVVPPRAVAVLPSALRVRRDGCVVSRFSLHPRVRFGPVEGINQTVKREAARSLLQNVGKSGEPIFFLNSNDDGGGVIHIDVSDEDKSNWFSLLPLGDQSTANVWLYQEDDNLYGITVKMLPPGTRLAIGYSIDYVQDHGIQIEEPVLDILQELCSVPRRWACAECPRAFAAPAQLRRHVSANHVPMEKAPGSRRKRHPCRNCTLTFSRMYSLKRHMARYCKTKKLNEKKVNISSTPVPEVEFNTTANSEDNRLPSDESLQNYTNGLDFSSSLFDTDRMPGLDISGSSRSEAEFNPYCLAYRDENELTQTDLGLDKLSHVLTNSQNISNKEKEKPQKPSEPILISCEYCQQTILREKKRQHLSECPERRFNCGCGRKFTNKEKFAQHVHEEHLTKQPDTTKLEPDPSNAWEYKCDKCSFIFKRRGMLVNHLWRVHATRTPVPLTQRLRLFPCGTCPKLYRAAAKRDRHVRAHHPGASSGRRTAIESGRRAVAPAECPACPRQYASRAKLLQHARTHHPDLALPPKKQLKSGQILQSTPTVTEVQQAYQYQE